MPEILNDKKVFSLLEVNRSIQKTIADRYTSSFWIKAEMNKLNFYSHSGHCYPELVEKMDGRMVAQMRSTLWSDDYKRINQNFLQLLNEPLKDGIKILFLAKLKFDPGYGLSLHIQDIDASFTLGDLEKEKQESIARLRSENLFDRNKKRTLALLPQRIAIISVETSKGYADFMEVIAKNQWNYQFFHMLFPAILQGENAIDSINFQLSQIEKVARHFDAVAIIRGGGGDVGLSCYNNYELAKKIAQFPLPVFTGIGHATNETVCEMISFQNAITPTKLAEILLQRFHDFARPVEEARTFVIRKALELLDVAKTDLHQEGKLFRSLTDNMIIRNKHAIQRLSSELNQQSQIIFQREKNNFESLRQFILKDSRNFLSINQKEVEAFNFSIQKGSTAFLLKQKNDVLTLEKDIKNMSPENVLRRGYSITLVNGKAVKSATEVSTGITITTQLLDGTIQSTINNIELKKDE